MSQVKPAQDQTTSVMPKPKLLMISSYRRPCGIAQYVEFLEVPLRAQTDFEFDIQALPVNTFRTDSPYARKAAKQMLAKILDKARAADVVSIQLEPGLFGLSPFMIWKRLHAIINASKRVILTYHTVPLAESGRPKLNLQGLKDYLRSLRGNYVFGRLFKTIRANPKKFRHIVQTLREESNFQLLFGIPGNTISVEPLSFIAEDDRPKLTSSRHREWLDASYHSLEGKTVIGCFGFLSPYKGIETAVKAMRILRDRYHLLIIGGLHPEGIVKHTIGQPYIQDLIAEIEKRKSRRIGEREWERDIKLLDHISFCGALNNHDFNRVMAACDAVVLPYAEVGQTSSGPAAIALDMQKPIYCARTHAFKELDRFQPGILSFFEIGNHIELAQKLKWRDSEQPDRVEARRLYLTEHNVEKRARLYLDAASTLVGSRS